MREFITINPNGAVFSNPLSFFKVYIEHRMPIAYKADTWFEAVREMFPELSSSEITRRIKSGALSVPEKLTLTEANQSIGLKQIGQKGFDVQGIKFGKTPGIVVLSVELRNSLGADNE